MNLRDIFGGSKPEIDTSEDYQSTDNTGDSLPDESFDNSPYEPLVEVIEPED